MFSSLTIQIPTGKVDPGELPIDSARRELMEETGLVADKLYNVDVTMFLEPENQKVRVSANFAAIVKIDSEVKLSPREHSEFKWLSLNDALSLTAFPAQCETLMHIDKYFVRKTSQINEV